MKKSKRPLKVAIVGATGAVGREMIKVLEQREFPVGELVAFASERSEGKKIPFAGKETVCQILSRERFKGVDLVFLDAADAISEKWVPVALEQGCWVVDNSSVFRLDEKVPLIVPEINGKKLLAPLNPSQRLISGPNCSTVQMVMVLKPLLDRWGIERVVVATYQSASGAGSSAMNELRAGIQAYGNTEGAERKVFPHNLAFNCIPQVGKFNEHGSTSEEERMIAESRKILDSPHLKIAPTCVRVPTFQGHAEVLNIQLEKSFELKEVREVLSRFPGIEVIDEPARSRYPMSDAEGGRPSPLNAVGADPVFVGRIRRDPTLPHGLQLWVVSDNLRKGAALNAVQIGEILAEQVLS